MHSFSSQFQFRVKLRTMTYLTQDKTPPHAPVQASNAASPPQCSSQTEKSIVRLASSGIMLRFSMTMACGTFMREEMIQMATMLFLARFAVLLNFSGWQIAYQRSRAMKLSVSTDTDTETVWETNKRYTMVNRATQQSSADTLYNQLESKTGASSVTCKFSISRY